MFMINRHEDLVLGPLADPNVYYATVFSAASLALVVWEAFLTLEDEVDHIWSKSGRLHVKWIYLFSKWFGLVNQIGIQFWRGFLASRFPVPLSTCQSFFIFETTTFQLLQLCLDAILILRIRAVHTQNYFYIATALAFVFIEVLTSLMTLVILVPKSVVDGTCLILDTPAAATCFGIAVIISQCVLLCLTYRGKVLQQPSARRSKIVAIVIRDGMLVFCAMIGVVMMSILYFLFNRVVLNVFLPWMPVVPAILTPRIILNMRMANEQTDTVLQFTTEFGTLQDCDNSRVCTRQDMRA